MATLPSALALANIADGSPVIAADHRNNYAAIQTDVNALLTILGAGTAADQFFTGNGTTVSMAYPPGHEIGYDQITAPVTVSSTTEATGTSVIAGSSHTFDGTPVIAEFFSYEVLTSTSSTGIVIVSLFEGATQITRLGVVQNPVLAGNAGLGVPVYARYRFTPSAAAHTYSVTAIQVNGNGTISAGSGGAVSAPPAYLRFTKV